MLDHSVDSAHATASALVDQHRSSRGSRRIAGVLAAIALVFGGLVVGSSAMASHCGAGYACLYDYDNYTGLLDQKAGGAGLTNLPTWARDKTASWSNDSSSNGCLYDELSGTGDSWTMVANTHDYYNIDRRDRAESWKLNGAC